MNCAEERFPYPGLFSPRGAFALRKGGNAEWRIFHQKSVTTSNRQGIQRTLLASLGVNSSFRLR